VPPPLDLLAPLLRGLWVTLIITAGGLGVAATAAFLAGLGRVSSRAWINVLAGVYVDFFRGTSALVQLFWAYFVLPLLGIRLEAITVGVVVLGLNIGAYGAEVVRSAIQAVPQTQHEAAQALNFTPSQTMRRIVLPQALLAMIPPFGNLMIELLKSTALVSLITLSDLTFEAQSLRTETLRSGEVFGLVLAVYFLVAQSMAASVKYLERRLAVGQDYGGVR